MDNLLQLSSLTDAMRARDILKKKRIKSAVKRIPASRGRGNCTYGVIVFGDVYTAAELLGEQGIRILGRAPS